MGIEQAIYSKLQDAIGYLVGGTGGGFSSGFNNGFNIPTPGRIYPVVATENTEVPFAVYGVTSTNPNLTLQGQASVTTYTTSIDTFGIDFDTVQAIAEAAKTALHGWREGYVLLAVVTNANAQQEEFGHHYTLDVTIYARN